MSYNKKWEIIMSKFFSYLDDFNEITIIVPKKYRDDFAAYFKVVGNDEEIDLEIVSSELIGDERKYVTRFDGYILLNHIQNQYNLRVCDQLCFRLCKL